MDPALLYSYAQQFYWDFRGLAEGDYRRVLDRVKLQQFDKERANLNIPAEAAKKAEKEIEDGLLSPSQKQERCRKLEEHLQSVLPLWPFVAREEAMKEVRIPGEPEVLKVLLDPATTPEKLREVCRNAFMKMTITIEGGKQKEIEVHAWPISKTSAFPTYLAQHAEQYVAALRDPRFPSCDVSIRPSNRLKQFWFLSRALAGAIFGVSTRTAINLVGSLRPEETFERSRYAKPERKRARRKYKPRSAN